ncbi:MAG: hypothetical protein N3A72_06125 [bacterium]|nr:hypothetical protein [bacterium]
MLRKVGLPIILSIVFASFVFAQRIEFEGRYWMPELSGKAQVTESGLVGTEIDLVSDLGFEDQDFPEARITWSPGPRQKIRIALTQFDYDGDKVITRNINFNGETYPAGTRVLSDVELQYARFGWIWNFMPPEEVFKLGLMFEVKGFWIDAALDAPYTVPAISEREEVVVGLPTIGMTAELAPIPMFRLFGEVSGIPKNDYGYCLDAEGGIKVSPLPNVSILGGYRVLDVKGEDDENDDFARVKLDGVFFAGSVRF